MGVESHQGDTGFTVVSVTQEHKETEGELGWLLFLSPLQSSPSVSQWLPLAGSPLAVRTKQMWFAEEGRSKECLGEAKAQALISTHYVS